MAFQNLLISQSNFLEMWSCDCKLMSAMCRKGHIPSHYSKVQYNADLSQYTLLKRRNLNTITKAPRKHDISYRWGHHTKITVSQTLWEKVLLWWSPGNYFQSHLPLPPPLISLTMWIQGGKRWQMKSLENTIDSGEVQEMFIQVPLYGRGWILVQHTPIQLEQKLLHTGSI